MNNLLETYLTQLQEAGYGKYPKGWDRESVVKFGKSLIKGGATKEDFFDKCVKKMKGKFDDPEAFCASVKDEVWKSTYWRGKDKSTSEVKKDITKHKKLSKHK